MEARESHADLPSTQLRAIELARAGAAEGTRVVARRQSAGRGRSDHSWFSPAGGLYLSIVLAASEPSPLLPLAIGAALVQEFRERYGVPALLKWPNDLVVPTPIRKFGGILVDRVPSPTLGAAVVVGVGLNVLAPAAAAPPGLTFPMTSLGEFVRPPPSLEELEPLVAERVVGARRSLEGPDGVETARRACRTLLYGVGRTVTVDGTIRGRIVGLEDDGALTIDTGTERVAIRAGDLRVEDGP
ncbi:MAG: biotin--[acetyl-CoA-carboxylase] ligase [Thermoplasmata archaeon]